MKIIPTVKWLELYNAKKHLLVPTGDLNAYFSAAEIAGQKLDQLSLGSITIPTGQMLVGDPLSYMCDPDNNIPYLKTVPIGKFPVTACVVSSEIDCARYAAVKVDFSNDIPIRYEEALSGNEDLENFAGDNFFGFPVDAGLAAIADKAVADAYCAFFDKWENENPNGNFYDDYFSEIFVQSYRENPKYQRRGGDWINWTIPNSKYQMPIFQSGLGDGAYPVYFGYNASAQICRLVIHFIDIELEFDA
jgi:hypothetical protein